MYSTFISSSYYFEIPFTFVLQNYNMLQCILECKYFKWNILLLSHPHTLQKIKPVQYVCAYETCFSAPIISLILSQIIPYLPDQALCS